VAAAGDADVVGDGRRVVVVDDVERERRGDARAAGGCARAARLRARLRVPLGDGAAGRLAAGGRRASRPARRVVRLRRLLVVGVARVGRRAVLVLLLLVAARDARLGMRLGLEARARADARVPGAGEAALHLGPGLVEDEVEADRRADAGLGAGH